MEIAGNCKDCLFLKQDWTVLMKKGQMAQVLAHMAEEAESFGRMLKEPAAVEAFTAFMGKRKPDFSKV